MTNTEEVELRSKIEALGLEVTKVPSKSAQPLTEVEIANELDKLSAKIDDVDEMISSALASDPQVQTLLSGTADVWMPVITANSEERLNFTASIDDLDTVSCLYVLHETGEFPSCINRGTVPSKIV